MTRQRGFSLFELVLAVATASIALTISLPAYQDYHYRSQMARLQKLMAQDQQILEDYQRTHQQWPQDQRDIALNKATIQGPLKQAPELLQSPRALRYAVSFASGVSGELLVEARFKDSELLGWHCRPLHYSPGLARYLPANCQ